MFKQRNLKKVLCGACYNFVLLVHLFLWIYLCFGDSRTHTEGEHRQRQALTSLLRVSPQQLVTQEDLTTNGRETFEFRVTDEHNLKSSSVANSWAEYYNPVVGHTLLPRNASIVLNGNFTLNPLRICSRHNDLDLLIVVHTAPYHFTRRDRIRRTLGNSLVVTPYSVQVVFMIGIVGNTTINTPVQDSQRRLEEEIAIYNDFVQMEFVENFRNLSLKAVMWLRWVNEHCPNAMMVLKIDDDVILDIRRILPLTRGLFSKYSRSIFCNLNKQGSQPIPRKGRTKVDPREFAGLTIYPYTWCSGFIVFLSKDIIPALAEAVKKTPFYNVDDLFLFGMVPKMAGDVTYHNLGFNVSVWHQKVFNCTVQQGSNCRYFGTMAEEDADAERVWKVMQEGHRNDFHMPQFRLR